MYYSIKHTIKKYYMVNKGDRVLVCVSGGPDSVFLLRALDSLKRELGIRLFVANLDHGLRGSASKKDSDFVRRLASKMKLPIFHEKLSFGKFKNKKLSTEENLRGARYEFFKEAAKKLNTNVIATGHTLDDNAETLLMRIIKGTSLKGLAGIPPVRTLGRFKVVRPLIETEKKDILKFLKAKKITFRTDRTNLDENFFRNKTRKKLLPYLSKYNPRIKFTLVNMAEGLREDLDYLNTHLDKSKKGTIKGGRKSIFINLRDLVVQPKTLQREIMRDALTKSGANIKKLGYRHWKELREFLKFKRKGQSIDLPGDIRITRSDNTISLKRRNLKKRPLKKLH